MNIKSFFNFDKKEGRHRPKITVNDKFFTTLFEILCGKRVKYMGDLARNFGYLLRRLNLEKSDPFLIALLCLIRKLQMQKPPANIRSLIYERAKINNLLLRHKSDDAIMLNIFFDTCCNIVFKTNSRDDILLRMKHFCTFFEEILLHAHIG